MDSITQATLGAVIGYAGWGHRLGKRAAVAGLVIGTLPDLDVVAGFAGQWTGLVHHRGLSHSLLFAPMVFYLVGFLMCRWMGRGENSASWNQLAFWVLWTHPMLDVFTPYGTQLFSPVTNARFALDGVSILDPLYTGLLFLGVLLAFLFRADTTRARKCLAAALALSSLYLGLGYSQSRRAERLALKQLPQSFQVVELRAIPTLLNIWWWRIVARDGSGNLALAQISTLNPQPIKFTILDVPDSPLIKTMLEDPRAQIGKWFAMDMVRYRVVKERLFTQVYMDDMRYTTSSRPLQAMWGARAEFSPDGDLLKMVWHHQRDDFDGKRELASIWHGITTGLGAQNLKAKEN